MPTPAESAEQGGDAVADMFPERLVEGVQALVMIAVAQRVHLVEQIGMGADRALPEHDEIAGQDICALHAELDEPFHRRRPERRDLHVPFGQAEGVGCQQNAPRRRELFHPGGQMRRLADRRVIHVEIATDR